MAETLVRVEVVLAGIVQGVGFRPRVCVEARARGLTGWVRNGPEGVRLQVQGEAAAVEGLLEVLRTLPPPARVRGIERHARPLDSGEQGFEIVASRGAGPPALTLLPDLVTCEECRREVLDPQERRHRYPFASCAICGPRYSIMNGLPWDRERTTMAPFAMCSACRAEYENPADRRFHAQTIACPDCGPTLRLEDAKGTVSARGEAALIGMVAALREGAVVALKGLGGYQLLADARSEEAVAALRRRKRRPHKPLALMVRDLARADALVSLSPRERAALRGPAGPIVLARAHAEAAVAETVAPGIETLGVMLPSTPLHLLLLEDLRAPIVATSGNLSGEPIFFRDDEARAGLGEIADLFCAHDREILQVVDDSVVREIDEEVVTLRCARGLAPRHFDHATPLPPMLAIGSDLKGALALSRGSEVVLGPHLGDLETVRSQEAAAHQMDVLPRLLGLETYEVVCDAHPDWASARLARQRTESPAEVYHHHAHAFACLLENGAEPPALAVTWDGTGYGTDGTIHGGEFLLLGRDGRIERVAHLRPFRLVGGEQAVREPRRIALALLVEAGLEERIGGEVSGAGWSEGERRLLLRMLRQRINAPLTSSAGRLFDGVAALLGCASVASYEAQAAMELEAMAERGTGAEPEPLPPLRFEDGVGDWAPLLAEMIRRREAGAAPEGLALGFHLALARGIAQVAQQTGCEQVALSGGCFQNARLSLLARQHLEAGGHRVLRHVDLPANDGGLAAGQILAAAAARRRVPAP